MEPKKVLIMIAACLVGTLGAIQLDHWLQARRSQNTVSNIFNQSAGVVVQGNQEGGYPDFREAVKRIQPSVVSIDAVGVQQSWFGSLQQVGDSGSGVVISTDGYIVTNAHVVSAGERTEQVTVRLNDDRSFPAEVIGVDTIADLAVLKIKASNLIAAPLGKSAALSVGEWVLALGNPFNQANTVSAGIVGNLGRDVRISDTQWLVDTIQTDAAINPGNSGGALANARGELVGINSAIFSTNRTPSTVGIGFAIPIDRAKPIIEDLIKLGRTRYGYIGLEVAYRSGILKNPAMRQQYEVETGFAPPEGGALIAVVKPNSPANAAGIRGLDIVVEVNGKKIDDRDDFNRAIYGIRPDEVVKMKVFSKGKVEAKELKATELQQL